MTPQQPPRTPRRRRDRRGRRDNLALASGLAPAFTPDRHFAHLVQQTLTELPEHIKDKMEDVVIHVAWLPPAPETGQPPSSPDENETRASVPLGAVQRDASGAPESLVIYRQPVVDRCPHPNQLPEVVSMVVVELVGDMLGIPPEDI